MFKIRLLKMPINHSVKDFSIFLHICFEIYLAYSTSLYVRGMLYQAIDMLIHQHCNTLFAKSKVLGVSLVYISNVTSAWWHSNGLLNNTIFSRHLCALQTWSWIHDDEHDLSNSRCGGRHIHDWPAGVEQIWHPCSESRNFTWFFSFYIISVPK